MVGAALSLVLLGAGVVLVLPRVANQLPTRVQPVAHLPERLAARLWPARVPRKARRADLMEPERAAVAALAPRLDGLIAWASNRNGHHELYVVDLRTGAVRQITHSS